MIDAAGTVRLIDFGATLVAGLAEAAGDAQPEVHAGELQYAAPECLLGRGANARSDLFSLAVVTYQMLTGRLPYGLALARARSERDLHRLRYVPLHHHRPELPAWLDAVLRKALQVKPQNRQEAMSEFAHDLRAPAAEFRHPRGVSLMDRDPVAFWRGLSLLLAALLLGMLMLVGPMVAARG